MEEAVEGYDSTSGESQRFCFVALSSVGGDSVVKFCQTIRASCIIDGIDNEMDSGKRVGLKHNQLLRLEKQTV